MATLMHGVPGAGKTVLLTLGRLPVALEIARAFHEQGWRVVVAETLGWHQCRLSNAVSASHVVVSPVLDRRSYQQQLLDIVRRENVSCVLPVSEEILYVAELAGQLPDSVSLFCTSSDTLERLHDKWLFAQWAISQQLPVPATALASSPDAHRLLNEHAYVIKPRLSCSGVGVIYGAAGEQPIAPVMSDEHVVQVRLQNQRCSSFAMCVDGQCLFVVTYHSLLENGSVSVCFERIDTPAGVAHFNQAVASQLKFSGMISFDFMQDPIGDWLAIECNPRATSGIHFVQPHLIVGSFVGLMTRDQRISSAEHEKKSQSALSAGTLPTGTRRQEFWSALTETEGQLFKGKFDRVLWRQLFSTRDISWSINDWKPSVLMPFATWRLLWQAIRQRKPVSQVAMLDIGYYGAGKVPCHVLDDLAVAITSDIPADYVSLVESVTFGTQGLRYQRRNVTEQHERFNDPVFVTAYVRESLVGVYVLDRRQLILGAQQVTGYYRGVLVVSAHWQGYGIGEKMTRTAMAWLEDQATCRHERVLSYGCIEGSNARSIGLLRKQGAMSAGTISMFMMYRQWPRSTVPLVSIETDDEHHRLLNLTHADCHWRDVTLDASLRLGLTDQDGIRISASVGVSEFRIVDMGFWLSWMTKLMVAPWPPARKRFNPDVFRAVVFNQIAVRPGCEGDWPAFVSAVLAKHKVHFGTVYPDPDSKLFHRILRVGWLGRLLHSKEGSIHLMARFHGNGSGDSLQTDDLAMTVSETKAHALFPVDN